MLSNEAIHLIRQAIDAYDKRPYRPYDLAEEKLIREIRRLVWGNFNEEYKPNTPSATLEATLADILRTEAMPPRWEEYEDLLGRIKTLIRDAMGCPYDTLRGDRT
jgi:hypothetical protein